MSSELATSTDNQNVVSVTRPVDRRRQVNWRLLIVSLVAVAALVPAVYAWHRFQQERVAVALLAKANQLDQEGKPREASAYLHRYLQMECTKQDSDEILARLAVTYDRAVSARSGKDTVIQWYYRALGATPERFDLRVRLAELFLETEQYVLAGDEADRCLAAKPEHPDAWRTRALARAGLYHEGRSVALQMVISDLERANQRQPGDLELAQTLASLYRNKLAASDGPSRSAQADRVMDQMVRHNLDRRQAHLARYEYRVRYGLANAADDLQRAVQEDPEHADVVFAAANAARRSGDYAQAELRFRQAMEKMPHDYRGYLGLGNALLRTGRTAEALEAWRKGAGAVGAGRLSLLVRLADTQVTLNQIADAKQTILAIDRMIGRLAASGRESMRDWAVASRDLLHAKLAVAEGQYDQAVLLLRRVASTAKADRPDRAESSPSYQAWTLLGQTYVRLQRWEDAANSFERSLHAAPDSNLSRIWAARCWNKIGQHEKAIALCEQALQRPPVPRSIWLMSAELHLRHQLRLPSTERDWTPLKNLLHEAQLKVPDSWEIRCLQATQMIASEARTPSQLQGNRRHAVRILQTAEALAPDSLAMWTRLVFYYDLLQQPEHVERALARVGQLSSDPALSNLYSAAVHARRGEFREASDTLDLIPSLPGDSATSVSALEHQKHWFAAQAFRRTGQTERAQAEYARALELAPDHPQLQIEFAGFLRPLDREKAEAMLRNLLSAQPDHPQARRLLATWLHWSSDRESRHEARSLLNRGGQGAAAAADRRLDATLRIRRGRDSDLEEARLLLEQNLVADSSWEDHRILAKVCELQGDLARAEDHLRQVVDQPHPSGHDLANLVDFLIRTDQADGAERWLSRLEAIAPMNYATLNLRLRHMAASGETVGLDRHVEQYIEKWQSADVDAAVAVGVLRQVARLLEELGRRTAAEKLFDTLAAQYAHHESLAFFWIRQGKVAQAIELCEQATRAETTSANATILARALLNADRSSPSFDSCLELVLRIRDENSRDVDLLFALANLYLVIGEVDQAIEELRIVTELAPEHVLGWNNLAAVLADQEGQHDEAMKCVNQAIAVAGRPLPMLLDTRAVLLMQQNDFVEAAALLTQAVSLASTADSRFQFHLAFALHRMGDTQQSSDAWNRAVQLGLDDAFLTDYEREWMGELNRSLAAEHNPR